SPGMLPQSTWARLHSTFLVYYGRGWALFGSNSCGGDVIWHNGSNGFWYALLMLLPGTNTVLAFTSNDGAGQAAETAFMDMAGDLTALAPGS
ncbi:MAG: hypothetical protein OXG44_18525, partial [Gammaproteobacteria bacterium]|nr:hypothetical protein [Gammaproteobacteria bacterium]